MKEKRLYFSREDEDFSGGATARQVEKEIRFSTDVRDFGYMAENVPCQAACPAITNVPAYIRCVHEGRNGRSYELNRMYNIIPAVLGRICSRPCEAACRHGEADLGRPVQICHLKRAAADHKPPGHRIKESLFYSSGKTVGVIGAGPAGLAAAHELATLGHKVTIYEMMDRPGGMLMYGIPEFRLPRRVLLQEVENILRLGVEIFYGAAAGRDESLNGLLKKHDAVIAATGCMRANRMGIPGEELEGVLSGLDFMMRVNSGERPDIGKNVVIIGDGFTAMDCSRTCVRLGAENVSVNIRRTEELMPVDEHERFEAKVEKVKIVSLVNSVRVIGGRRVEGMVFERNRLDYAPKSRERISVPIEDSRFEVPADTVICAIGQVPQTDYNDTGFKLDGARVWTRPGGFATNVDRLYAAGDCMSGAATVIAGIARGRAAAHEVDAAFAGRKRKIRVVRFEPTSQTDRKRAFDFIPQVKMPEAAPERRLADYETEVEQGFAPEQAAEEAKRCYLCYLKYEIDVDRCIYCSYCIDVSPRDCIKMISGIQKKPDGALGDPTLTGEWKKAKAIYIDNKRCIRCGACLEVCPTQCISVSKVELIEQDLEV